MHGARRVAAGVFHQEQARDRAALAQKAIESASLDGAQNGDQLSSSNCQSEPKLSRFGVLRASPFGPSRRTTSVCAVAVSSFSRATTVMMFVPGESSAFCHYLALVTGTRPDARRSGYWVRGTTCFERRDGEWLVTHEHISMPAPM